MSEADDLWLRDSVVELKTMFKMAHEENRQALVHHTADDSRQFAEIQMKVNSAHSRLDNFKVELTNAIKELSAKIDSQNDLKNKVMGGAVVVMFLFTTALTIWSIVRA